MIATPDRNTPDAADLPISRSLRLAELVAARLCHDISGALGTVANALELAVDDPGSAAEALAVASDASGELGLRLRVLRACFVSSGESLAIGDLLVLARGLPAARRMQIDGSAVTPDRPFRPLAVRLMLNLFALAAESLPSGGRLAVAGHPGRDIVLAIEGPRAAWPAGLSGWLSDEQAAWRAACDARTLTGPLVVLIAREQGMRLSFLLPVTPSSGDDPLPLRVALGRE